MPEISDGDVGNHHVAEVGYRRRQRYLTGDSTGRAVNAKGTVFAELPYAYAGADPSTTPGSEGVACCTVCDDIRTCAGAPTG